DMIPRNTMLRHRVGSAAMPKLVVLQTPYDRKQQRRMAGPLGSGLPHQFASRSVLERAQLPALPLDGRSDLIVANNMRLIDARGHFHLRDHNVIVRNMPTHR